MFGVHQKILLKIQIVFETSQLKLQEYQNIKDMRNRHFEMNFMYYTLPLGYCYLFKKHLSRIVD